MHVLVVDGDRPYSLSVISALAAAGCEVEIAMRLPVCPASYSRFTTRYHVLPDSAQHSESSWLSAIEELCARRQPDVVLAVDEPTIGMLAGQIDRARQMKELAPVPPKQSFDITVDKSLFAEFLTQHGLPHPRTIKLDAHDNGERVLRELSFPMLAKPCTGGNGRGIVQFADASAFETWLRHGRWNEPYVVQEMVNGSDVDCSVLCHHGEIVASTVQRTLWPSKRQFGPAQAIELYEDPLVTDLVSRLMRALRWEGVCHIDLRRDQQDGSLYFIEVNPRFWGSLPASVRAGVNFPLLSCQLAMQQLSGQQSFHPQLYAGGSGLVSYLLGRKIDGRRKLQLGDLAVSDRLRDPMPALYEQCHADWMSARPKPAWRNGFGMVTQLFRSFSRGSGVMLVLSELPY